MIYEAFAHRGMKARDCEMGWWRIATRFVNGAPENASLPAGQVYHINIRHGIQFCQNSNGEPRRPSATGVQAKLTAATAYQTKCTRYSRTKELGSRTWKA